MQEKNTTYIYVRCGTKLKKAVGKLAKMKDVSEAEYARNILADDAKFKLPEYGKGK